MSIEQSLPASDQTELFPLTFAHPHLYQGLLSLFGLLGVLAAMAFGYWDTQHPATLLINGQSYAVRTHQTTVGGLLNELGLELQPEDIVQPGWDVPLDTAKPISVIVARQVVLTADNEDKRWLTHSLTPGGILRDHGIILNPHDKVLVDGRPWQPESLLAAIAVKPDRSGLNNVIIGLHSQPLHLEILRAVPFALSDAGVAMTLYTTGATLADALAENAVPIYDEDKLSTPLNAPISPGLMVHIDRSKPFSVAVDGGTITRRSRLETVGAVLNQAGVTLQGKDYTRPALDTPLKDNLQVEVIRVREEFITATEEIPFEVLTRPDNNMELDQSGTIQQGVPGQRLKRTRVTYENNKKTSEVMEKEWVDKEPVPQINAYGQKIVLHTIDTPDGPKTYWRKMRVLLTAYTAATSGKSRDHPAYGITRLGFIAKKGVVAVDPKVINFYTQIYIPGYGVGAAVDTGGLVKGRHVDLGYDEDNLQAWYKFQDVYLLTPPPPADEIQYVLPNYPKE
ncbi:MAG: DUF348 domain-containing protein [Chloroflexi bacterium]|nr:DUF348 domain-containing protein [Chloroflexota bacterium]